jgi:hypothetical protein
MLGMEIKVSDNSHETYVMCIVNGDNICCMSCKRVISDLNWSLCVSSGGDGDNKQDKSNSDDSL